MEGNELVGFKLYGMSPEEASRASHYRYSLVVPGKYCLVYDRCEKPHNAVEIDGENLLYLGDREKNWLAECISDIVERIQANIEYDKRTKKISEFIDKLREELEKEREIVQGAKHGET